MLVFITMMFNWQSQQWYQFKIFTKLKHVSANGAGCFVTRVYPLDLKKKEEVHKYVTLPATSSSIPNAITVTRLQLVTGCRQNVFVKREVHWKIGVTSVGNQDILSTHQACGVKFLLTFGTTLPRDLKIWAVYNREANVALLNTFKSFVQITLPVFQAIPDGAILQYGHSN